MTKSDREKNESFEILKKTLKPGDTVYTCLRHVSRSGMSRDIDVYFFSTDERGEVCKQWLSYHVARLLGWPMRGDAVRVSGCGMDMGFHIVYALGATLFKDFTCPGKACVSADHHNPPYPPKEGTATHSDGGYALNHRWI